MSRPPQQSNQPWDRKAMDRAITAYRHSGNSRAVVELLGIGEDDDTVLGLQRGLALAQSRREKDAFEDIAAHESQAWMPVDASPFVAKVRRAVEGAYGPHVQEHVDIHDMAVGLLKVLGNSLPVEAAVAVIGVEAERVVANSVLIGPVECGSAVSFFKTNCTTCGGVDGGRGHLHGGSGRPCPCASEVDVPVRPRDGEIVLGKYQQSGQPRWFTLRLES